MLSGYGKKLQSYESLFVDSILRLFAFPLATSSFDIYRVTV